MNVLSSPALLDSATHAALFTSARQHDLWATNDLQRLPMAAAHNVAELEQRAYKRRTLHRAALDIARKSKSPATCAINLRIAAGERRALSYTLAELRRWLDVMASCRGTWSAVQ